MFANSTIFILHKKITIFYVQLERKMYQKYFIYQFAMAHNIISKRKVVMNKISLLVHTYTVRFIYGGLFLLVCVC